MASNSTSLEFQNVIKMLSGIKFCPTAFFANASQVKKQSLRSCCCSFVSFLVPVLHAGYLCYYTALNQFVHFVEAHVWLLECSPASCLAPQNHCEEKHKKFLTHRIINKSPSHFSFDPGTVSNLKSWRKHIFSFEWMKNSFSRGETSLFERNTILSHLPRTLKVFWWLIHFFLII